MHSYKTEIYLPCDVKQIAYKSRRKSFSQNESEQQIRISKVSAVPFFNGALIFIGEGVFFMEDFAMLLEIDSSRKTLSQHLHKNPHWKKELEELNAVGGLKFGDQKSELRYSREVYQRRSEYSGNNWINFSLSPIVLELDITNICNAYCVHCSRNAKPISENYKFDSIEKIFQECDRYNIPELLVMGGEPLMHPDFTEILASAKNYGIKAIRTSTNGIAIDKKYSKVLSSYATHVQVSIHGATIESHERLTQCNGSFKRACEAVELLVSEGIDVAISFTVMDENEFEIEQMAQLSKSLGAHTLRYLALSSVGRGIDLKVQDNVKRDVIGERIKRISEQYESLGLEVAVGGFPSLHPILTDATIYGCAAGRTHFHISYDGFINPCGSVEGYIISNFSERGILDSWHDQKLKDVRRASQCDCAYRFICSGSCKADTDFIKYLN